MIRKNVELRRQRIVHKNSEIVSRYLRKHVVVIIIDPLGALIRKSLFFPPICLLLFTRNLSDGLKEWLPVNTCSRYMIKLFIHPEY